MSIFLLLLVLAANGAGVALRRRFRERSWRSLHMAIAAWVLTASGFLVVYSVYSIFDSWQQEEISRPVESAVFLGSLFTMVVSLTTALPQFFQKPNT